MAAIRVTARATSAITAKLGLELVVGHARCHGHCLTIHFQASSSGGAVGRRCLGGGGRCTLAARTVAAVVVLEILASVEVSVGHLCADPVIAGQVFQTRVAARLLGEGFKATAVSVATTALENIVLEFGAGEVLHKLVAREVKIVAVGITRALFGGGSDGSITAAAQSLTIRAADSRSLLTCEVGCNEVVAAEDLASVEHTTGAGVLELAAAARPVAEGLLRGQVAIAELARALNAVEASVRLNFVAVEAEGRQLVAGDVIEQRVGVAANAAGEEDLVVAVIGVAATTAGAVQVEVARDVFAKVVAVVEVGHGQGGTQSITAGAGVGAGFLAVATAGNVQKILIRGVLREEREVREVLVGSGEASANVENTTKRIGNLEAAEATFDELSSRPLGAAEVSEDRNVTLGGGGRRCCKSGGGRGGWDVARVGVVAEFIEWNATTVDVATAALVVAAQVGRTNAGERHIKFILCPGLQQVFTGVGERRLFGNSNVFCARVLASSGRVAVTVGGGPEVGRPERAGVAHKGGVAHAQATVVAVSTKARLDFVTVEVFGSGVARTTEIARDAVDFDAHIQHRHTVDEVRFTAVSDDCVIKQLARGELSGGDGAGVCRARDVEVGGAAVSETSTFVRGVVHALNDSRHSALGDRAFTTHRTSLHTVNVSWWHTTFTATVGAIDTVQCR